MKKSGYRTIFHIYLIFLLGLLGAFLASACFVFSADYFQEAGRFPCKKRLAKAYDGKLPGRNPFP